MDVSFWYCVALAASLLILVLWRFVRSTRLRFSFHDRHYLSSRIRSLLFRALLPRAFFGRLNFLDLLFLASFMTGNGLATGLSLFGLEQLQHRAATVGSINLLPVFVGRRIYTSSFFGASVQSYHLIHGSLAIVGVIQAALHSGLAIRSRSTSSSQDQYIFYTGLAVSLGARE
ncbi:serine/threonine-protein kinase [Colletotrichum plurivorum]|uniref:Serine/threonine-protein kinase n=1 Tax=Colletotrichum plurivorum TaxID=2175906 RepID=A0A8H6MQ87_9PEZI|nr:serine/threonine-protein kinase [Colletotrichum plurivorum]